MHQTDPSQNFIGKIHEPLDVLFHPQSVAVIGAKDDPGTVAFTILQNLKIETFKGRVYSVNPKRKMVLGEKCYPSIKDIPENIDLAVIVTPAKSVVSIIKECVESNVKSAIIISAGFKERGEEGELLEQEIVSIARKGKMPLIGPNCLGVMNPHIGLNATFAKGIALPGNLAFISQSGAMCTAVLDWSLKERIGFSSFVSIGSMADIGWGELIHYLGEDPYTDSILIYMETIGDPRSFLTAAREIALEKPIIVIKGGRSPDAARAAASHTGSLAGSDEVFEAALARAGVLRVNSISELFDMAAVLSRQPLPKGPNLAILTNAGGPSVLATDKAVLSGAAIAHLTDRSLRELDALLPAAWSHSNPVDILGDAAPDRYEKSLKILSNDENIDGILVILSPQDVTDPLGTAESIRKFSQISGKPLLTSWMGGESVLKGKEVLTKEKIPTFAYPDDAAWAFAKMWEYRENLIHLYETPSIRSEVSNHTSLSNSAGAKDLIEKVLSQKRFLLDEFESKELLNMYLIPTVQTKKAFNAEEAAEIADHIGFPVVLKLLSKTITHKTDVGGVILNIKNRAEVIDAFNTIKNSVVNKVGIEAFEGVTVQEMIKLDSYEIILGCSCDEQFGPVILFGTGGQLVEIFKDRALALPPLNQALAKRLMRKTKIYEALEGVRGRDAVDIDKLAEIITQFSQLILENPSIKEIDINPLLVSPQKIIALDARIVLHENNEKTLPVIRPYPYQYVEKICLNGDEEVLLRPIKPEDELAMVEFHKNLSEFSVRQRYFEFITLDKRVAHQRLIKICFNDYDRELALVAILNKKIIGISRLSRVYGKDIANFTMIIADDFHKMGLGTILLKKLILIAKEENISKIHCEVLNENIGMLHLCEKFGFIKVLEKDNIIYFDLKI